MKVGDMVKWLAHDGWDLGGRGVIIEIREVDDPNETAYKVAWLTDIEDFGWSEVMDNKAMWYDPIDFEDSIELVVETQ